MGMSKAALEIIMRARDEASRVVRNVDGTLDDLSGTLKKVGTVASVAVTAPLAALAAASVDAAMEADRLAGTLENLAGGAEQAGALLDAIGEASRGTVSEVDALAVANRALTFGLVENADQMEQMAEIAITLGRAQGLTATQAISDMTTALARESEMILDNLGITMSMTEAQEIWADALGKTTDELTAAEEAEAFRQAALIKGMQVVEQMGGIQEDARMIQERYNAAIEDAKVAIGNELLPVITEGLGAVTEWVQGFREADEETRKMIVTVGALAAAVGPAALATSGLIKAWTVVMPIVSALPGVLSAASVGMQLYAEGASVAQIASLGWAAALGPILAVVGAVAASAVAIGMAVEFASDQQEHAAEVADTWTAFLQDQVDAGSNAVAVAEEYAAAQERVNQRLEDAAWWARMFMDESELLYGSQQELTRSLIEAADSYEDYATGVEYVNQALVEMHGEDAQLVEMLDETEYQLELSARALSNLERETRGVTEDVGEMAEAVELTAEEMQRARSVTSTLTGTLDDFGFAAADVESIERDLATQFGTTTTLAFAQQDALVVLADALERGAITQEQYVAAGLDISAVTQDNTEGYVAVAAAIEGVTGPLTGLGGVADGIPGRLEAVAGAAANASAQAEQMAQRQESAWQSFSGSVEGAVGRALEAYQSGNAAMLAEQQIVLAEMLMTQTDQMVALGQITETQGFEMRAAIADEFGILVDEADITTTALLGLFNDWAVEGTADADEVVAFIENIGSASEELVAAEEAHIQRQIDAWNTYGDNTSTETDSVLGDMESIETTVAGTSAGWGSATRSMMQSMALYGGSVGSQANRVIGDMGRIASAINSIPTSRHITITSSYNGPPDLQFQSPEFKLQHGIERLVDYASRVSPIELALDFPQAGMVDDPGAFAARGLPAMGDGGGGGGGQTVVIENHFGPGSVRSDRDIEEISRRQEQMLLLQGVRRFEVNS